MDETGWRVEGLGRWLWAASSEDGTAYNVADGMGLADATDRIVEVTVAWRGVARWNDLVV